MRESNVEKKSRTSNYKRRLASMEGCLIDLKDEIPLLFKAYREACMHYNSEVIKTPPEARCRGFEAALLNSKLIHAIQNQFPREWKYGKYRRFILYKNGYLVLFKKLNSKGMPMNIPTKFVESINAQQMGSLFDFKDFMEDPILYFGYRKDSLGRLIQPQLVYIDEGQVQWTIGEKDITDSSPVHSFSEPTTKPAEPKIRRTKQRTVNE